MSSETDAVQRQLDAFNAHDLETFLACFAPDIVVRHGDGRELMNGPEAVRSFYGPFMTDSELKAEVSSRLQAGPWVVDHEHTVWTGGVADALVAYEVRDARIRTMVMLGGPV